MDKHEGVERGKKSPELCQSCHDAAGFDRRTEDFGGPNACLLFDEADNSGLRRVVWLLAPVARRVQESWETAVDAALENADTIDRIRIHSVGYVFLCVYIIHMY